MNGKHYIGSAAVSFQKNKEDTPITCIRLIRDDGTEYTAGDMSGHVLEYENPYATQEMAENILADVQGFVYKGYTAGNTVFDPLAELGDGVTINGFYSTMAYRHVTFSPGHVSDIAAPGNNEPDDEYPYKSQADRSTNRKIKGAYSAITKSAEDIKFEVGNTIDGLKTSFQETVKGFQTTVEGYDKAYSSWTQTVSGFENTVKDVQGNYSTLKDTVDGHTTQIGTANGRLTTIEETINGITVKDESGKATYINPGSIQTGSITASMIDGRNLNVNNNFIIDDQGNVTINGNINFASGSITWGSNYPSSGISESRAHTLIKQDLVASPTIAGGSYYDLNQYVQMTLSPYIASHNGHSVQTASFDITDVKGIGGSLFNITPTVTFSGSIREGYGVDVSFSNTLVFSVKEMQRRPIMSFSNSLYEVDFSCPVDFSNANVTGLTAVFG